MAVYNLGNYLAKDGFGMSLNIRRGNPNPLDNSSVWDSLAAAQNYAQTDPVAYVGQILTVVSDVVIDDVTVKTATAYVIDNEAGDLKEVGSSPVGDEKTITVSEDGTVSLYGIAGLALTREVEQEDGSKTTEKINYQPLLVDGKLTWIEPSATTVEGLATEIEGLKTRIDTFESTIGKVTEGKTLVEMIADVEGNIPTNVSILTNDAKYQTDTDVQTAISEAIAEINHAVFQKVDEVPTVEEAEANVLYLVPNDDKMDIYAKIGEEMVLIDDTDTDLSGYALKSELHEHTNKTLLDSISSEKIAAWDVAEKNIIASVDEAQFSVDEDRKLTLLDIAMGKVTGLTEALEDKADKGTTLAEYGIIDAYTKTETETRLQEVLDGLSDTSETAASVAQALETYKTSNNQRVDTVEAKLETIAEGAQINIIESIEINGIARAIKDKAVNIPVATDTLLGVVMSSTAENKITVAEDGTMEVNSVNVNKLVQDEGTTLILNGGTSSI